MKPAKTETDFAIGKSRLLAALALVAVQVSCHPAFAATDLTEQGQSLDESRPGVAATDLQKSIDLLQHQKDNADALSDAYRKLANSQALDGQTVKAEASYRKSLSILQSRYGASNIKCAPALVALGGFFESLGDHSCASAFYEKATMLNEKRQGAIDPSITTGYLIQRPGSIFRNFDLPAYSFRSKDPSDRASLGSSRSLLESLQRPHPDLLESGQDPDKVLLNDFEKQYGIKN